jgi:GT2 family glycosyltransferase
MLADITERYSFLDRNGLSLNLERATAHDQHGRKHDTGFGDLTSIVIISAERGEDTSRCVKSIFENTQEPFEIIISDVGSSRETLKIINSLEDEHQNVHIIYNKESTGTTGQRNQGLFFSRGGYVVFMDNDVIVLPRWLKPLKDTAKKNEKIGLVGAKLLQANEEIVYYCGIHTINLEKEGLVYGIGLNKGGRMARLKRTDPLAGMGGEVPWYTTTTILARRGVLFEVGGFDDMVEGKGIFIANEDKDLSLSVRKAGYRIHYCPDSETVHHHDYTKVDRDDDYHSRYRLRMEQIEKDTRYFLNKWAITYLIEKLPHEDNSRRWDGRELVPVDLDLDSDDLKADVVTLTGDVPG